MNIGPYLKKLGHDKLKDKQVELVNCVIRKEDSIGILPTGYGKSVCYILPHLIRKKNVIVISPLISLMKDQRLKLNEKGINTISFNSSTSFDSYNKRSDLSKLKNKEFTGILYFSPESFMKNQELIHLLLKKKTICLFAIDECHCITSWSDFREDYDNLHIIKELINGSYPIPMMALTATATNKTIDIIKSKLKLDTLNIIKSSFMKTNLNLNFIRKTEIGLDLKYIQSLINTNKCKTIIYCKTKKETEELARRLIICNIPARYYHSEVDAKTRSDVQDLFTTGKINVITATIAFGMGIDISDIYMIIHYGISKDIESYYQEIGRAGRDGKKANCYLFWADNDFRLNNFFVSKIKNPELKNAQKKKNELVKDLIFTRTCRMKYIVKYFDEECDNCNNCDNCINSNKPIILPNNIYIFTILKTFIELPHGIGMTKLIKLLFGSQAKDITENMKNVSTYGIYSKKSNKKHIELIVKQLIDNNLLQTDQVENINSIYYNISSNGKQYYKKNMILISKSTKVLIKFGKYCIFNSNLKNKKGSSVNKLSKTTSQVKKLDKQKKTHINHGKRWSKDCDNKLSILIQQFDLNDISTQIGRSKKSTLLRILHNIGNDTILIESLSNCNFVPSNEKIKVIKDIYIKLKNNVDNVDNVNSMNKQLKLALPDNYTYTDILFALSKYGNII